MASFYSQCGCIWKFRATVADLAYLPSAILVRHELEMAWNGHPERQQYNGIALLSLIFEHLASIVLGGV